MALVVTLSPPRTFSNDARSGVRYTRKRPAVFSAPFQAAMLRVAAVSARLAQVAAFAWCCRAASSSTCGLSTTTSSAESQGAGYVDPPRAASAPPSTSVMRSGAPGASRVTVQRYVSAIGATSTPVIWWLNTTVTELVRRVPAGSSGRGARVWRRYSARVKGILRRLPNRRVRSATRAVRSTAYGSRNMAWSLLRSASVCRSTTAVISSRVSSGRRCGEGLGATAGLPPGGRPMSWLCAALSTSARAGPVTAWRTPAARPREAAATARTRLATKARRAAGRGGGSGAGVPGVGASESGTSGTGLAEAGVSEARVSEARVSEAGVPEAGVSAAGVPKTAVPPTGSPPCGSSLTGVPPVHTCGPYPRARCPCASCPCASCLCASCPCCSREPCPYPPCPYPPCPKTSSDAGVPTPPTVIAAPPPLPLAPGRPRADHTLFLTHFAQLASNVALSSPVAVLSDASTESGSR